MSPYDAKTIEQTEQTLAAYYEQKDFHAMLPILENLIREDMGKIQLWKYRAYYRALPDEIVDGSPAICSALCLLAILAADTKMADTYMARLRRMQLKYRTRSSAYGEIENYIRCMEIVCPHRNNKNMYAALASLVSLIKGQETRAVQLSLTANRPSIMNGGRDFSDYAKYIPGIKGVMRGFAKVLYGSKSAGMVDVAVAEIYYQQDRLYDALVLSVSAIPFIEREGDVNILFAAMFVQFCVLVVNKQIESTHPMAETMREKIVAAGADYLLPNLNALRAWAAMYDGNYGQIDDWFRNEAPNEYGDFCTIDRFRYFIKLRCYLLYDKHLLAVAMGARLRPVLMDFRRHMELCELDMLLAISHFDVGDWERAFTLLENALDLGKKYRFDRVFADEGERLYLLLLTYEKERGGQDPYLTRLLELCYKTALNYPNYLKKRQSTMEPMSDQEMAVLTLLAAGRSNAEIGKIVGITVNTVKFHTKGIYNKLGLNSRMEAVTVAKEVGLL